MTSDSTISIHNVLTLISLPKFRNVVLCPPATTNPIQIAHGKGLYLLVSIDTRNAGNTQVAMPLIENMLNYVLTYAGSSKSVGFGSKLTTTWASIKANIRF